MADIFHLPRLGVRLTRDQYISFVSDEKRWGEYISVCLPAVKQDVLDIVYHDEIPYRISLDKTGLVLVRESESDPACRIPLHPVAKFSGYLRRLKDAHPNRDFQLSPSNLSRQLLELHEGLKEEWGFPKTGARGRPKAPERHVQEGFDEDMRALITAAQKLLYELALDGRFSRLKERVVPIFSLDFRGKGKGRIYPQLGIFGPELNKMVPILSAGDLTAIEQKKLASILWPNGFQVVDGQIGLFCLPEDDLWDRLPEENLPPHLKRMLDPESPWNRALRMVPPNASSAEKTAALRKIVQQDAERFRQMREEEQANRKPMRLDPETGIPLPEPCQLFGDRP